MTRQTSRFEFFNWISFSSIGFYSVAFPRFFTYSITTRFSQFDVNFNALTLRGSKKQLVRKSKLKCIECELERVYSKMKKEKIVQIVKIE